ncbi:TRAP-type C4-dicarboxylate transport system, periplasmic component [Olavius sp. associated proteobacterium Delta 1]|nr:TRAP-type C4-dicarboxylate transport system, periplasmic component [Olavius sp. associated proteobacterium Delta 1]
MIKPNMIKAIGISFLTVILLIAPHGAAAKITTIKIATLAPEGSTYIQALNDLNAELKQKTNNDVRLRIYPGGVLGDEKDMRRKMHVGQIHGAVLTSAGLSGIFSEMDVFQIPFLFEGYDEVDYVVEKMDEFFKKGLKDKGYILLGWSEAGFIRLLSTHPIATLDDLRKAKVWTWEEAPMAKAIFDEAGISAIPLSLPDVLVGLQTGLVEVVYAPPAGAISLQWFTKTKFMTEVPLMYLIGGVVIKKNVFNKLPPNHQQVLMELYAKYMGQLRQVIRRENQEAIKVMAKHGVKLIYPSEDQIEDFKRVSKNAMNNQTGKSFSAKVKNEILTYLEEYRGK